jgi:hypothetical protein
MVSVIGALTAIDGGAGPGRLLIVSACAYTTSERVHAGKKTWRRCLSTNVGIENDTQKWGAQQENETVSGERQTARRSPITYNACMACPLWNTNECMSSNVEGVLFVGASPMRVAPASS